MFAWRDQYLSYNGAGGGGGGDPYWTYVSLLENFEIPQTSLLDSSTNNFTLTRQGASTTPIRPTLRTPFASGAGGSMYWDGTASWIEMPASIAWSMGTGNFTFEAWVYVTNFSVNFGGYMPIIGWGGGSYKIFRVRPTAFNFQAPNISADYNANWPSTMVINTWYHVALVRSSTTTVTAYLNGVAGTPVTISASAQFGNATDVVQVGYKSDPGYWWGYISNWRLVKGTAVYTSNFTPSTTPLTAISGTSGLLNFTNQGLVNNATFVDSSITSGAVAITGTPRYSGLSPFTNTYPGSVYFPGGSSYLTITSTSATPVGTGAYTVECWVYYPSLTAGVTQDYIDAQVNAGFVFSMGQTYLGNINGMRIAKQNTADCEYCAYTWSTNTWYHIATVRSGTTIYFFVNGVQQTTLSGTQSTGSFSWPSASTSRQGAGGFGSVLGSFTGYITNLRTSTAALYTSNFTPSTVPLTALSTTTFLQIANGGFQDVSTRGQSMTSTATALISTQQKKFGTQSVNTIASNYQTVNDSAYLQFGTNAFTIEGWVYRSATGVLHSIISKGTSNTGWTLQINTSSQLIWTSTTTILKTSTTTIGASTWTYFAITRTGTTGYMFINGTQEGATYSDTTNYNQTSVMYIGADRLAANSLNGYLDDIRVTTGVCRYTASFSAPTAAFPTS